MRVNHLSLIGMLFIWVGMLPGMEREKEYQAPRVATSYFQLLPQDLVESLLPYFATPGLNRDNRADFFIEQRINVLEYMTFVRAVYYAKSLFDGSKNISTFLDAQMAFARAHPEEKSYYCANAISAAAVLNTAGARASLKKNYKEKLSDFKGLWQAQKDKILIEAIRSCPSKRVVTAMIEHGANVNAEDEATHDSALSSAVQTGKLRLVRALLQKGAYTAPIDRTQTTPLMNAARSGQLKIARELLQRGAFANSMNIFGYTALSYAARGGNKEMVNLLLEHGASLILCDQSYKRNALACAAKSGNHQVLVALLERTQSETGVDSIYATYANIALRAAAKLGNQEMIKILLASRWKQRLDPDLIINQSSALSYALSKEHFDVAHSLLAHSIQHWSQGLRSAARSQELAIAVEKCIKAKRTGNKNAQEQLIAIITDILEDGADPQLASYSVSACMIAAMHNDEHVLAHLLPYALKKDAEAKEQLLLDAISEKSATAIRALIKQGANGATVDDDGNTFLHRAVFIADRESVDIVAALLPFCDMNAANAKGDRPLHWLMKNIHSDARHKIFIQLLQSGVMLDAQNKAGNTALHTAADIQSMDEGIIELLLTSGAQCDTKNKKGETPLFCAARRANVSVAQSLLAHGADPNAKNNSGCGPLTKAARTGSLQMAALLIRQGAQLNEFKDQMLREASKSGNLHLMQSLLALGADKNSVSTSYGNTPLHKAVSRQQLDAAYFLCKIGALVNARNGKGQTPLDIAKAKGFLQITKLLMKYDT